MGGSRKIVLAVDHGTSGVKTALVTVEGKALAHEFEATPLIRIPGGGAEQDPELWWRALANTSRKLMASGICRADEIAAVCVSSTFSSTVAVGSDGRHLMNSLTWMDSRGAPHIKKLVSGFPEMDGYGLPQMLPWIWKTAGGPQLSGKDDIAHALYIKNELPEVFERTKMFMGSKDYLNLRLTGEFAASHDSMSLFWLTDIRDIDNPRYDGELIAKTGLSRSLLPPMVRSIDKIGPVRDEVAGEIGLPRNTPVFAGSPDHQSACIGSGAVRDFEGHLYVGTSSWLQCIVPFKKTDVFHSIATLATAIPGKYYCVNEQDIAGGALPFLLDNILLHPAFAAATPDDPYARLFAAAQKAPPGSDGLIFTPWLNGERTPVDDTAVRANFLNMSFSTDAASLARATLEGVALNNRWALKYVERFVKRRLDPINIIGGGARSPLWRQIFADALGRSIRAVADPMQANARGAAFIAAAGLGEIGWDQIPELVEYDEVHDPDPKNREVYDRLFDEFTSFYKRNKRMYRRLNGRRG